MTRTPHVPSADQVRDARARAWIYVFSCFERYQHKEAVLEEKARKQRAETRAEVGKRIAGEAS